MRIKAERISAENFRPYGVYIDLYGDTRLAKHFSTERFDDSMSVSPLIETPAHLGMTVGSSAPCEVRSMEKHNYTREAIFCQGEPVVLCVALSHGEEPPRAEDVRAFIVHPGDVAIMERDIWHDSCYGLGKRTAYYYLATPGRVPAAWVDVKGKVEVELP